MTLLELAKAGKITEEMEYVAKNEEVTSEYIRKGVAEGTIVILNSPRENIKPIAVGKGMFTKVNASIGLYEEDDTIESEMKKVEYALKAHTDTIMDLSVRGDIKAMREQVLSTVSCPVGTLPIYETLNEAAIKYNSPLDMTIEDMLATIEEHAKQGVSFVALHPATLLSVVYKAKEEKRVDPLVSYGGSHLIGWMIYHEKENPLYENFDKILEICKKYDVVLSFADGMRPGTVMDSLDGAQVEELVILGSLVRRAREANVQVMVKGPGHVMLDQIETTVKLQKKLCLNAPYFVFGCLPTDTAVGNDHITSAIGGAIAGYAGADFLCYVTPAEHIGMPNCDEVYTGVMASRMAAHAADVGKRKPAAVKWDRDISVARRAMDWETQFKLAIDPETARRMYKERSGEFTSECTMCGKYCAMKIVEKYFRESK